MAGKKFALDSPLSSAAPRRVVEFEFRLPRRGEIKMPAIDVERIRKIAETGLITGIGFGVLLTRAIRRTVEAANQAGREAVQRPGPVTRALLGIVRPAELGFRGRSTSEARTVSTLPIEDYAQLTAAEVVARLSQLNAKELRLLREYETAHANRVTVLRAIDARLAAK